MKRYLDVKRHINQAFRFDGNTGSLANYSVALKI
jgi:hypothetical protein